MKSLLFKASSLLLLCLPVFAANEIYITQVGTSNNFTLDILQDGDDNEVRLSVSHDNNNIDIDQVGENNTISWVSYWGSGLSWGGDLDGSGNTLKFEQFNTTGTDENVIGFTYQLTTILYTFVKVKLLTIRPIRLVNQPHHLNMVDIQLI